MLLIKGDPVFFHEHKGKVYVALLVAKLFTPGETYFFQDALKYQKEEQSPLLNDISIRWDFLRESDMK